jgi:MFS family permease
MILLDTTIVNVAIPAMSAGLNTTLDQILWVLNAYILTYAVLLITAGRLGDLYGQRNLFAIGLFIFTVASALCGFSQNANELIAARVLQGIGGAVLTPQTLAIITTLFPPERRGAAFGSRPSRSSPTSGPAAGTDGTSSASRSRPPAFLRSSSGSSRASATTGARSALMG